MPDSPDLDQCGGGQRGESIDLRAVGLGGERSVTIVAIPAEQFEIGDVLSQHVGMRMQITLDDRAHDAVLAGREAQHPVGTRGSPGSVRR